MATICRTCGQSINNGFQCGCGINKDAVSAFVSKGNRSQQHSAPHTEPVEACGERVVEPGAIPRAASTGTLDEARAEESSLKTQVADLKAEVKRIEGEIDALFKQRKSTSSPEWYFFAIDQFAGANQSDDPKSIQGLYIHILIWAFFGFAWIPVGYIRWLLKSSERLSWNVESIRQINCKINEQIKSHRNRRTVLFDKLKALTTRLKELAEKEYVPTWKEDPTGAATASVGDAASATAAKGRGMLRGLFDAIPVGTCPKCRGNWAKEADGQISLNTNFLPKVSVEKGKGFERETIGVIKIQHYRQKFKCKKCSHAWSTPGVRRLALKDACPKCFRENSRRFVRTEELGHEDRIRTVEREAGHYDKDHHYLGTTVQAVQVTERTIRYQDVYGCTYCDHQWSQKSSRSFIP